VRAVIFDEADGQPPSPRDTASPIGDVVVEVAYSAVNYKDWLVGQAPSRARRAGRLTLGVEACGTVAQSAVDQFAPGDKVLVFGGGFGVSADGGFAERAAAPARYVTKLPAAADLRSAAAFGLAGFTALASVLALEDRGLAPGDGDVLVTGATGGVGSLAVTLLAQRGHRVAASTGSPENAPWLRALGAAAAIDREEIGDRPDRTFGTERWSGAIDCVGGATLAQILRSLRYGGTVAASGLVAGAELVTTVYPFITRAVSLVGVDSVEAPPQVRDRVMDAFSQVRIPSEVVERTVLLAGVVDALATIGRGETRGRWLVDPNS
jgi:acrylyl-CoA reductase (NADPH)